MRVPDGVAYVPSVLACVQAGTATTDQFFFFGYVPVETTGLLLRASNIIVSADVPESKTDYWNLLYGLWTPGAFQVVAEHPLQDGVKTTGLRRTFPEGSRVPRGFLLALKALRTGQPAPLQGLCVALEYGILGSR